MREDNLIQQIATATRSSPGSREKVTLGIGDDAALWRSSPGTENILTCDWFIEGTHFLRRRHSPDSIGWKCLARAVSDVAAMGGVPRYSLLSLALPSALIGQWLEEFLNGLQRASQRFACQLLGGDTTRHGQILINVSVVGEVKRGLQVLRSGARAGDMVFTSGRLGEAELGLRSLCDSRTRRNRDNRMLKKHLYPEPRIALGHWLAKNRLPSAMMDLSDGLSTDLPRLCAASGVGARINAARIPTVRPRDRSKETKSALLDLALHGGDDYELLFTASRKTLKRIPRSFGGVPISAVGEITEGRSLLLVDSNGREEPLANRGWDPFRGSR